MSTTEKIGCAYCVKESLSKDEIGLNKRLINRKIERMMCLACMAAHFEVTEEELIEKIDDLKRNGCTLFK